ncbi:MAG: hypothetical protein A7315_03125 [Candidatus Altiarchaeales archaeon WOR_SM1_79]|nr:MAG: hypothetical protein A7315_03125 [Candidatus Altiarchaeales archaeon WOR_SM1_79]
MEERKDITFLDITDEEKKVLLDFLDYSINEEGYIINAKTGDRHICPITRDPVLFKDASILHGSNLVINTTPLTISEYLSEYIEE